MMAQTKFNMIIVETQKPYSKKKLIQMNGVHWSVATDNLKKK